MGVEYDIIYTDRRSIGLRIKDGRLTVRAPRGTPREYIDSVVQKHSEWIAKTVKRETAKRKMYTDLTDAQIMELKTRARQYFEEKCAYYARLMGVRYRAITITSAKTRFGSCSSSGRISFSYRIMLYPEPAWEYVAVHELAHLIRMDHSPRFYAVIERYLPDYKERKKLLRISV